MTGSEEHVVRTLVDLCTRKLRGRAMLNAPDCLALLGLYEALPGYVNWDMPIKTAVQLTRMLADPVSLERRAVLLAALKKAAAGQTQLYCNHEMAGELLCLFDCDARRKAAVMAGRA